MPQRSRTQIAADIAAKLPDNTTELITEAKLREVLTDLNDSAYNTASDGAPVAGAHTHAQTDITGLTAALASKAAAVHTHSVADVTGLQGALDAKQPAGSYAPATHSHAQSDITGLVSALSGKADAGHTHSELHTHANKTTLDKITEGAGLPLWNGGAWPGGGGGGGDMFRSVYDSNNDGKVSSADAADSVPWAGVTGKPSTFTPSTHGHGIADVVGLQPILDGKAESGHTHVIAHTTGLQAALDAKAAASHTHAQSDVTGLSTALAGKADTTHSHAIADTTGLQAALDAKQPTLVSGTNIKTVNGTSLLGSGNLEISGGGGGGSYPEGDLYIDLMTSAGSTDTNVSTGDIVVQGGAKGPALAFRATSSGARWRYWYNSAWQGQTGFVPAAGTWIFSAYAAVTANTAFTTMLGFCRPNTTSSGVYFRGSPETNSGNWQAVCRNGGSATVINSSVPISPNSRTLRIVGNSTGTSFEFFIDGTSIGSITTNIPSANNACALCVGLTKSGGSDTYLDVANCYTHLIPA